MRDTQESDPPLRRGTGGAKATSSKQSTGRTSGPIDESSLASKIALYSVFANIFLVLGCGLLYALFLLLREQVTPALW